MFDDENANPLLGALKHRRKLAFKVFLAVLIACEIVAFLTKQYSSSAVLAVNLPAIGSSADELQSAVEVAWSSLPDKEIETLIDQFQLNSGMTRLLSQGQIFTYVRSRISLHEVQPEGGGPPEIVVSYTGSDRSTVIGFTNALALSLGGGNKAAQQVRRGGTATISGQLNSQLEKSRKLLQLLSEGGQNTQTLKAQLQQHLKIDAGLRAAQHDIQLKLSALEQERHQEELAASKAHAKIFVAPVPNPARIALQQQEIEAQNRLADLRQRYTEEYPDVVEAKNTVADLQAKLNRIPLNKPPAQIATAVAPAVDEARIDDRMAPLQDTESELEQKINNNREEAEVLRQRISDGASFAQDYALEQARYNSLLKAQQAGAVSTGTEGAQLARSFIVVQSATTADAQGLAVKPLFWVLSFLGSLLAALLTVYLAEQFNPVEDEDTASRSLHVG